MVKGEGASEKYNKLSEDGRENNERVFRGHQKDGEAGGRRGKNISVPVGAKSLQE